MAAPTDEEMIAAAYTIIEWCDNKGCDECPIGMHGELICDRPQEPTVQSLLYELVDYATSERENASSLFWKDFEASILNAFKKSMEEREKRM